MARMISEVPGVYLPDSILQRMEVADKSGNAAEEGVQIALELINKVKGSITTRVSTESISCRSAGMRSSRV
jgi:5,10-methylenetetrahydrofolate reductase